MTERISNDDWDLMKAHYIREFDGLGVDLEIIEGHLKSAWELWNQGAYPNIDKFAVALDEQFQGFANMLKERDKQSFENESYFDDLNDKWGELVNQGLNNIFKWHLVVFPLGAMFTTLLLVVFIGEPIREAFDPKLHSRLR